MDGLSFSVGHMFAETSQEFCRTFCRGVVSRDIILPFERFGMRNWELMIGIYLTMTIDIMDIANGFSHFVSSD